MREKGDKLLDINIVAKRLSLSTSTIIRMYDEGTLQGRVLVPHRLRRTIRIFESSLDGLYPPEE